MVTRPMRNPFRHSDPNQKVPAVPGPLIRRGDLETDSPCSSSVCQTDSLQSQPDIPLPTGTPGDDNQVWIAHWINSTGEPTDAMKGMYSPMSAKAAWNTSPTMECRPDAMNLLGDDANSVVYSSSGQEFFDFHSSSSDAGRSSVPSTDKRSGPTLQGNMEQSSHVGGQNHGPQAALHNGAVTDVHHSQMMMQPSEYLETQNLASNSIAQYENSPMEIGGGYYMEFSSDSPPQSGSEVSFTILDDTLDGQGYNDMFSSLDFTQQTEDSSPFALPPAATYTGSEDSYGSKAWVQTADIMGLDMNGQIPGVTYPPTPVSAGAQEPRSVRQLQPKPPHATTGQSEGTPENEMKQTNEKPKGKKSLEPRSHEYYSKKQGKDGFYHCPFKDSEGCSHTPTKQKCSYDKYLDAHLKPYRCKRQECAGLSFSSNAVLGRHERETHGMHGHGQNPYICHFPDCRRSVREQGFPRRWNARDHMERVHGVRVTGSDAEEIHRLLSDESASVATPKRKGSTVRNGSVPMKKTASSQSKRSTKSVPEPRKALNDSTAQEQSALPSRLRAKRRQSMPAQAVPHYPYSPPMEANVFLPTDYNLYPVGPNMADFSLNY